MMMKNISFAPVSALGTGTFKKEKELRNLVHYSRINGIHLFDTSDDYGTEIGLGRALREEYSKRDDYQIVTKFTKPEKSYKLTRLLQESIVKIFGVDDEKVDLLLMHWPYPFLYKKIWAEMIKAKRLGLTKHIGVCNFGIKELQELKDSSGVMPEVNQIEVHPLFSQDELCKFCAENNIIVMCYSPFGRGNDVLLNNDVIKEIAKRNKKTVQQIILRWDIQHSYIPIPASGSKKHIAENAESLSFRLSTDDMNELDALNSGLRTRLDAKTFFSMKQKIKFALIRILWTVLMTKDGIRF
nr:aldo/keto reductase [uncultured Anaerostipes sp.]